MLTFFIYLKKKVPKAFFMDNHTPFQSFTSLLLSNRPDATAWIQGNDTHPGLSGLVRFYHTPYGGTLVNAEIFGLPNQNMHGCCEFYAFHIHEFGDCTLPFDKTGTHYNPANMPHPDHAGDLPPLLGNQGYAWQSFFTRRFTVNEIIGKSVIVHSKRDDFTTQPSGDAGEKIGCGVIRSVIY